jgi:sterol desaturase/sphingolipid hydroxylase (fatty acid hydroxylase superfamily)
MVLIVASIINMKKIVHTMQNDPSLGLTIKMMFRISFVFSFIVVLFLFCMMGLSMFELRRNTDIFQSFTASNNIRYKNLRVQDGSMYYLRHIIVMVVIVGMLFALAETLNLFVMKPHKPAILVLLVPIFVCFILIIQLYNFSQRRNVV